MCSQIEFKMYVYFGNNENKEAELMNQFHRNLSSFTGNEKLILI